MKLAKITLAENENKYKCSSCTLYIVLFSIIFTINVGIGTYFVYFHWYIKKKMFRVLSLVLALKQKFNYLTYKWEKSNKLTLKIELIIFATT